LVVAGERAGLDLGLGRGAAQLPERSRVLGRGDRAVARERARVLRGDLARVEADGEDLALRDLELDAAADQARVERVVVGVDPDVGSGAIRVTRRRSTSGMRSGSSRIIESSSASRSTGRQRRVRWKRGLARSENQRSSCSWKSSSEANERPGSKLVSA
jgi:hypothetical protein